MEAVVGTLVFFAFLAMLVKIIHRQRLRRPDTEVIDDDHDVLLKAMAEWLNLTKVQAVAIREGQITPMGITMLQDKLYSLKKRELEAAAGLFLRSREVRRTIAHHLEKHRGMKRSDAMRLLGTIAEEERPPA